MPNDAKKLTKYVLGECSKVGDARRSYEDRVFVGFISRNQGETLLVGMVADGVGSADAGSRAAQLAIDTARQAIETSAPGDKSIPDIIEEACLKANRAVYQDNQVHEDQQGQTTLVLCVIQNDRFYVGNIGDSRAYWVTPQGKLLQLTKDHTFYNIHGGSPSAPNANAVVNAIGLKRDIEVDLGIYIQPGATKERAYQIGYSGIALQPGDAIVLCSDGLIKTDSAQQRFASDEEIVQAIQTEYETNKAAIKMVSVAEGRRPNDNVSAVTIQLFSDELLAQRRSIQPLQKPKGFSVLPAVLALFSILLVGAAAFAFFINRQAPEQPTALPSTLTSLPTATNTPNLPTATPTEAINPGQARVEAIEGTGANVRIGQYLLTGAPIESSTGGIKMVLGTQQGRASLLYWLGKSAGILNFDSTRASPALANGAICLNPQDGKSEVHFSKQGFENTIVQVENGRMIVELVNDEIVAYCFLGDCQIDPGGNADLFRVSVKNKRAYLPLGNIAKAPEVMSDGEMLSWDSRSLDCLDGLIATPTPTKSLPVIVSSPTRPSDGLAPSTPVLPTDKPVPPTEKPTPVPPPTDKPTTVPPPTDKPTHVPPPKKQPTDTPPPYPGG